jgi:hypothetical protein
MQARRSPARLRLVACALLALVPCLSPKGHVHAFVFAVPLLAPLWASMLRRPGWWPLGALAMVVWITPVWSAQAWLADAGAGLRELWYARLLLLTLVAAAWGLATALRGTARRNQPEPADCQRQAPAGRVGLPASAAPGIGADSASVAGGRQPAVTPPTSR